MTDTNRENMEFLASVYGANKPNLMDKPGVRRRLVGSTGSDSLAVTELYPPLLASLSDSPSLHGGKKATNILRLS